MAKVRVKAFVTYEEVRDIEVTSTELDQLREWCADRIESAFHDDEGEFVESSTSFIRGDSWELVEDKAPRAGMQGREDKRSSMIVSTEEKSLKTFGRNWVISKFVVYFTGEVTDSFIANDFAEVLTIVERETVWKADESHDSDTWNPWERDAWGEDDNDEPFIFSIAVGEISHMTIVRITE